MNKRGLKSKITKKLDQLSKLLDNIDEVRAIDSNDPDSWDNDSLYNLAESLKDALKLLEDQKIKGKYDEFGQPVYEEGLCSLVDIYQEDQADSDYDE